METIDGAEQLREAYGAPSERSLKKQLSRLDKHCATSLRARRLLSSRQPTRLAVATRPRRATRRASSG